nr:DUF2197 domain-containing protein [Paenibacillus allorhizosphaerae]
MSMFSYEAICFVCQKVFKAEEGSQKYKQLKEDRKGMHYCEQCNDKIRLQAILNFFKN